MSELLRDATVSTLIGATILGIAVVATGGTTLPVLGAMLFGGGAANLLGSFGGK